MMSQLPLEGVLNDEILRMYQEVADHPTSEFHFFHGREAAELFDYAPEWLDRAPAGAVDSFAGVGNPHRRSNLQPGETVSILAAGAGLDAIIASWAVGPRGGDRRRSQPHDVPQGGGARGGDRARMGCGWAGWRTSRSRTASVDAVLSNGVINLSFRKRRVIEELFGCFVRAAGSRITDIVSAKQLSQSIVNDPKLWAS